MYYLIGIGGTGARCMEAFVNLLGAGLLNDKNEVKLAYIDADESCGNLDRAWKTMETYRKIANFADDKWNFGETGFFKNKVNVYPKYNPIPDKRNMDEMFDIDNLDEEDKAIELLYKSLYKKQEGETDLGKGFRGHPCIGAAIINSTLTTSEFWSKLRQDIKDDQGLGNVRVFLFASAFGGTGAAGFPNVAERISALKVENKKLRVGGAFLLPYFTFEGAEGDKLKEMQAKSDEFIYNTKAALKYYRNNYLKEGGKVFDALYLVGDKNTTKTSTHFSLGAQDQRNDAHFVELYAALAAFDFCNKDFAEELDMSGSKKQGLVVARRSGDKVGWDDIPGVNGEVSKGRTKQRIVQYLLFLYSFDKYLYSRLVDGVNNPTNKNNSVWYKNLVGFKGSTIVTDNNRDKILLRMQYLQEFSRQFFSWFKQLKVALVKFDSEGKDKYNPDLLIEDEGPAVNGLCAEVFNKKLNRKELKEYKDECNGLGILYQATNDSLQEALQEPRRKSWPWPFGG